MHFFSCPGAEGAFKHVFYRPQVTDIGFKSVFLRPPMTEVESVQLTVSYKQKCMIESVQLTVSYKQKCMI